jgi:hypothetical protein
MTAEQEIQLLAKLERIAAALEGGNTLAGAQAEGNTALSSMVQRIACALEKEPPAPPQPPRK